MSENFKIEPGMRCLLPQVAEVVRPANTGEIIEGDAISNRLRNKFWCKIIYPVPDPKEFLCCFDLIGYEKHFVIVQELEDRNIIRSLPPTIIPT